MAGLSTTLTDVPAATGCCPAGTAVEARPAQLRSEGPSAKVAAYVRTLGDGTRTLSLAVPDITCASCIARVESAARSIPAVTKARVNFSTKRVAVDWEGDTDIAERVVSALSDAGYASRPFNPDTVAYAGRPFFRGALTALIAKRLSMDVPISLALILATGMSLVQTMTRGDAVYFDASVMLLFFLLLGRVLDLRVRARARSAAQQLLALRSKAATIVEPDGTRHFVQPSALRPGMRVFVAAGERMPADGSVLEGNGFIDNSLLTGESVPESVEPGPKVYAGAMNLSGALQVDVKSVEDDTLLAEIVRLMETAEQGRARYVRIADRVARAYAPFVHVLDAATLLFWLAWGAGWETSLLNGIAVLIITCPCALALAVPAVQVVAGGRLLKNGVLVKSGDALERLAEVDTVIFDKTGTLTTGALTLAGDADGADLALAAAIAQDSSHPLARALARACGAPNKGSVPGSISEIPGLGLLCETNAGTFKLGSRKWVGADAADEDDTFAELWLQKPDGERTRFAFADQLRGDAGETVRQLVALGLDIRILSGDRPVAVKPIAQEIGVADWRGGCDPKGKAKVLRDCAAQGHKVLMVGDGLNDAPALSAAHVSFSPADAADIAQNAADFVSLGDGLAAIPETLRIAKATNRLVLQNFALSFGYNLLAVPIAMAGFATPLLAAVAMSSSSLAVTLNALRLKWMS